MWFEKLTRFNTGGESELPQATGPSHRPAPPLVAATEARLSKETSCRAPWQWMWATPKVSSPPGGNGLAVPRKAEKAGILSSGQSSKQYQG